jgi:DNA invertase Pin-like site-specific DNA recombinase
VDLVSTLQELTTLDVGFVSLSEALDLTTPSGRALAGMLAVFAEFERDILRDRVKAGIDQARKEGKPHGRPKTAGKLIPEMKQLRRDGLSKRAIAKQLGVSRTSVIRLLRPRSARRP